jgi:transposase
MSYKLNFTQSEIEELKALQKTVTCIKIYKRLQCIYLISRNYSNSEISDILDVSNNTITTWIKIYKKGGLSLLQKFDYKARKSRLSEIKEAICNYIKKEMPSKVAQVQDWIRKTHNIEIEYSWLYRYLKKNSICLIKKPD